MCLVSQGTALLVAVAPPPDDESAPSLVDCRATGPSKVFNRLNRFNRSEANRFEQVA